jgi:signal transduction histidine kinase
MTPTAERHATLDVEATVRALTTFVRWDQAALGAGVVALVATYATLEPDPFLLLEAALCALAALALGRALRPLRRGDREAAVTTIAVVNWLALLTPSVITPFVEPIMLLAALLPVVLAVPYVSPARLLVFVAAATGTSIVVLGLARWSPRSSIEDDLPGWLPHGVVALFVPILSALLGLVVWHHHATLRRSFDQAQATNRRLVQAQRDLVTRADDLRASRARLATATDDERRRIERDLHDGVQQQLLALSIDLTIARAGLPGDAAAAIAIERATDTVAAAMQEIRDLARGIYPATLTDHGLVDALAAVLRQWSGRCRLVAEAVGRYPADVEAAVYFSCTEAINNAIRHAGPEATVTVRLADDHALSFEVSDDGAGFDTTRTPAGRGLTNLVDRLSAIGGTLTIDSRPGDGTTVRGVVPGCASRQRRSTARGAVCAETVRARPAPTPRDRPDRPDRPDPEVPSRDQVARGRVPCARSGTGVAGPNTHRDPARRPAAPGGRWWNHPVPSRSPWCPAKPAAGRGWPSTPCSRRCPTTSPSSTSTAPLRPGRAGWSTPPRRADR